MSDAPRPVAIEVTDAPPEADLAAVLAGLQAFNEPVLGKRDHRPLAVLTRAGGILVGGVSGATSRGFLRIDLFWVAGDHRGRGLGTRLLLAAEAEARRRGCHSACLDTLDFQARPFYERHGYHVFGELAGYPGGHRAFYMVKRFEGAGSEGG